MDWRNKIVVVTGADKAAGRAVAQTLTAAGASVQALNSPLSALREACPFWPSRRTSPPPRS